MNSEINYVSPFKRFCITIGNLPTAYIESMSYYEGLTFLVNYLANNVIPALNNNGQVVEELQEKFVELKNFVDEYFANLDVQEEINTKLDEMADDGTLSTIISLYLNSIAIFAFDNVNDMKNSINLADGSYAKTVGFYDVNDGGSGLYKIREVTVSDVVDEMFIISLTSGLVAELIVPDNLNILTIGAKNLNTYDNYDHIQAALNSIYNVFIPDGEFHTEHALSCTLPKKIFGNGNGKIVFDNTTDDGLTIGDSIELCGIKLNTGTGFTGTVLTYDGEQGVRTYPSLSKIHDIEVSTNATSNIECLFDFRPDRNYGITLSNIKLGNVNDSRKADYGFKSLQTKWANSITINSMNIDIYGANPLYINNDSNVSGSGKNWTLNNVTVQCRSVTYNAGFYFKNMLNLGLNGCYLWDSVDGTFPNGKVIIEKGRYISTIACSEEFYSPTLINPVAYTEAYTGYSTEFRDNYHRTPLTITFAQHGEQTKIYPLFFPSYNFIEALNDIELFTRFRSATNHGLYFSLTTRGMTNYNNWYARDVILHANKYNTTPLIYKIQLVEQGTIVWIRGNTDLFCRCNCKEKPYFADNEVVTDIGTGNAITLTPYDIGANTPLPQTTSLQYFYGSKEITTF